MSDSALRLVARGLSDLRADFVALRQGARPILFQLVHKAQDAARDGVTEWPPPELNRLLYGGPCGKRDMCPNFDEQGNLRLIDRPRISADGKLIVDKEGRGVDVIMRAWRSYYLVVAGVAENDPDVAEKLLAYAERGGQLTRDNKRARQRLEGWRFQHGSEFWWSVLFELASAGEIPGVGARPDLWLPGGKVRVPYDSQTALQELWDHHTGDEPPFPESWLIRKPEAHVTDIKDAINACVGLCDVLLGENDVDDEAVNGTKAKRRSKRKKPGKRSANICGRTDKQKRAMKLLDRLGTIAAVAKEMGIADQTASRHISQGRKNLAATMKEAKEASKASGRSVRATEKLPEDRRGQPNVSTDD